MATSLKGVLFDLGDTLVRLDAAGGSLVRRAAVEVGAQVTPHAAAAIWADVVAVASTPEELAKGRDLSSHQHRDTWTALYRRAGADEISPALADAIYSQTLDPNSWKPFADAPVVLRTLSQLGLRVGAVSDTGFDMRPILAATGLAPFIDPVVMSYLHGASKPSASIFLEACQALGLRPAEILMVGDGIYSDAGAVAAGLPTLLLPSATTDVRGLDLVLRLVVPPQPREA